MKVYFTKLDNEVLEENNVNALDIVADNKAIIRVRTSGIMVIDKDKNMILDQKLDLVNIKRKK